MSLYGYSKMELCFLRGSPWSLKIVWAVDCLSPELRQQISFTDKKQASFIKTRIDKASPHGGHGERDGLYTLPVLFYTKDGVEFVIRNGIEIVEFLCVMDGGPFATAFKKDPKRITDLDEKFTKVMEFLRFKFFVDATGPFTRYAAPWFTDYIPFFHKVISSLFRSMMKAKYEKLNPDKGEVEQIMNELNTLAAKPYLCEEYCFADISACTMIEQVIPYFGKEKVISFGPLDPEFMVNALKELGWKDKYPNVFRYRSETMQKHFANETRERFFVPVSWPLEVDCSKI